MGLEKYKTFIGDDKPAPDTVNPSLWRNAQLNMHYGLYKVTDRIYQVRGYDLKQYSLVVENGVLNYANKFVDTPDATLTLTTLDTIQLKQITVDQAVASNALVVEGKQEALTEFLGLLDTYPFWFNIVTP